MIDRIADVFAALRARSESALVCYTVAGDPDAGRTVELVCRMAEAGADAIELGVPYSDPVADGPSIQAGALRALAGGMTVGGVMRLVERIRKQSEVPIILMTYVNPSLRYGLARFADDASQAGADAVIQTDLPPEESAEWLAAARSARLGTVYLAAPTSTEARIAGVCASSSAFVYCVSRTGVTGTQHTTSSAAEGLVELVRRHTNLPVCVGFGISRPPHVREVSRYADGAVVGSALVEIMGANGADRALLDIVGSAVTALKSGTRPA